MRFTPGNNKIIGFDLLEILCRARADAETSCAFVGDHPLWLAAARSKLIIVLAVSSVADLPILFTIGVIFLAIPEINLFFQTYLFVRVPILRVPRNLVVPGCF